MTDNKKTGLKADNYGEVLAQINQMELVSFQEDGGYQGEYLAVLSDGDKLYYFKNYYGSCSGCDWMEDVKDWNTGEIPLQEALNYCADLKPIFIVPISKPLVVTNLGGCAGFKIE